MIPYCSEIVLKSNIDANRDARMVNEERAVGTDMTGSLLRTKMDGDRLLYGKQTSLRCRTLRHHEGHSPPGFATLQLTGLH